MFLLCVTLFLVPLLPSPTAAVLFVCSTHLLDGWGKLMDIFCWELPEPLGSDMDLDSLG